MFKQIDKQARFPELIEFVQGEAEEANFSTVRFCTEQVSAMLAMLSRY